MVKQSVSIPRRAYRFQWREIVPNQKLLLDIFKKNNNKKIIYRLLPAPDMEIYFRSCRHRSRMLAIGCSCIWFEWNLSQKLVPGVSQPLYINTHPATYLHVVMMDSLNQGGFSSLSGLLSGWSLEISYTERLLLM